MTEKQLEKMNGKLYGLASKYNEALNQNNKYSMKSIGREIDDLRTKYFSLLDKKPKIILSSENNTVFLREF